MLKYTQFHDNDFHGQQQMIKSRFVQPSVHIQIAICKSYNHPRCNLCRDKCILMS